MGNRGGRIDVLCGDVIDMLADYEDETFTACFCDPPYGLRFMGKRWDHGVPGAPYWAEVLRVLKPGAVLLAFGGTRTWHRLACAIEDAGFEIYDTLMWLYGSGFPKSHDISKAIDKVAGAKRDIIGAYRVSGNALTPTKAKGGTYGVGAPNSPPGNINITAPATPDALTWHGYGTALKPAVENVIVARKPKAPLTLENICSTLVAEHLKLLQEVEQWLRSNESVNNAEECSGQKQPKSSEVEADIVLEPASENRKDAANGENARSVGRDSTHNAPQSDEARQSIVADNAAIQHAASQEKTTRTGREDDSCEVTDMSPSAQSAETTGWSMMSSWRSILDGLLSQTNKFTTETATGLITDLRILNWSLSQAISANTIHARSGQNAGSSLDVSTVAENLSVAVKKWSSILEHIVADSAISNMLAPDWCPIFLARKPRSGTYAQTAIEHGTAALNIDGCRVGTEVISQHGRKAKDGGGWGMHWHNDLPSGKKWSGRWPANLLLNEDAAAMLDEQSGLLKSGDRTGHRNTPKTRGIYGQYASHTEQPTKGDTGGASRFFYCAKASRRERDAGLEGEHNGHPTVKPLALCEYLARLILPPEAYRDEATLLVPFAGSGSEMIGAWQAGWRNILGIELNDEYCQIARARLAHWTRVSPLESALL